MSTTMKKYTDFLHGLRGKILLGCFEPKAKPWGMDGIPEDFCFDSLPQDMEHFLPVLHKAVARMPILENTGIQTWFNGPEAFTPDDRYLLGETAEVKDLFVACGFNSIGIQSSGGAGKVLAEWIRDRRPPMDVVDIDVVRMNPFQGTRAYLKDQLIRGVKGEGGVETFHVFVTPKCMAKLKLDL